MRSPFVLALIHPLNLFMLVASVIAGLISAWWLFPVGLLFWLIMFIAVARDPALRINYEMRKRTGLAQRFQRYFDRIERAQVSIFNSLASASSGVQRALQPVRKEVDALTDQAYALCQRMTRLDNYRLVSESQTDLTSDLQRVQAALGSAQDPMVRKEYEDSQRSMQQRLDQLQRVSTQLDRVEAQLLSLTNEMDGVVAEVLRLQALGAGEASRQASALVQKLRGEAVELSAFEQDVVQI